MPQQEDKAIPELLQDALQAGELNMSTSARQADDQFCRALDIVTHNALLPKDALQVRFLNIHQPLVNCSFSSPTPWPIIFYFFVCFISHDLESPNVSHMFITFSILIHIITLMLHQFRFCLHITAVQQIHKT